MFYGKGTVVSRSISLFTNPPMIKKLLILTEAFSRQDRCFEAAISLIEAVLVKRWFTDTTTLWMKQATWHEVYNSVREKQFHRVKRILVNIYGKVSKTLIQI